MKRGLTGHYLTISTLGEPCRAFVPHPLPPDPPVRMDDSLHALAQEAALALCRLDAMSALLPEPQIFLYSYVRKGDWEEWIAFFLEGVAQVANGAVDTAQQLLALVQQHQQQVRKLGRTTGSALRLLDHLQRHPVTTAPAVVAATGMSFHTAQKMLTALESLGLVAEGTGRKYGKHYRYTEYLALLNRGT